MLAFPPQTTIYVIHDAVDFRNGIEGCAGICRSLLKIDPSLGAVFAFRNKSKTSLKILFHDAQGFWLCQKRLGSGRFKHWPNDEKAMSTVDAAALLALLNNRELVTKKLVLPWNKI